ncbi:MAG TPA: cytochrome c peroxidase [Chitinophagaceae bacterium]|nr:cytochrome c peroxidase [Chitinophagaceae bacterium]
MYYKELAVLSEYYNPFETKYLNGPVLERVEEDNPQTIISPHGFQLLEEYLYGDWGKENYKLISKELEFIFSMITRLQNEPDRIYKFKDETVLDAMQSSVLRLITLGISGFDSPVALLSINEATATLTGIQNLIDFYKPPLERTHSKSYPKLLYALDAAKKYLSANITFNDFDRLYFIKEYGNPLYILLGQIKSELQLPKPDGRRPINSEAISIFEPGAFNIGFFSPDEQYQVTTERVALGKRLFSDPILSETKNRSCASCHKPELAFTDGLPRALALDGKTVLKRNTPTLWNTVLQTRQFYDSRTSILENQLDEVVHNAEEMKGSLKKAVVDLQNDTVYNSMFKKAYPGQKLPLSPYNIANAISSYVRTLVALDSRFDHYMRGDKTQLNEDEKKGFNLFMGKGKCGTCHFIPLFNGLVPPEFHETESEVLGVPKRIKGKPALDDDLGKYNFTKASIHKHSFKTPTLRNIALTAPYMHNGIFNTLEQVVDFYDKGGGAGLKIAPDNQTLPSEKLMLTKKEKKAIIAFMHTLTDTAYNYKY